jgi:hypothetical protein
MTDSTSDDVRDDLILQERLSGRSARSIGKELRCTVGEVNAALDRTLPQIDNSARLLQISLDLHRLEGLLETFYKRAIEKVDCQAGLCVVKILERKAALLGLDQLACTAVRGPGAVDVQNLANRQIAVFQPNCGV